MLRSKTGTSVATVASCEAILLCSATVSAACAQQQQPDRPLQLSESALHHRVSCAGACLQLMPVHASITKLLIKSHYKGTAVAAAACAQNTAHTKTVIPT
eukprot:18191-Heterococcus_DN1.PRE.1